ncbi:MAG: type VI secretion system baseplate subunit TssG [Candidatus Methylopumilus sp.]|nr:type VI secretion system baseplate subunit TssG [Candidatus Methylopumilus sp.]
MAKLDSTELNVLVDFYQAKQRELEFFQLARLLARHLRSEIEAKGFSEDEWLEWEALLFKHLRVRPILSMGFPDTDIASIEKIDQNKIRVETTFFGLYGVTSPLPNFYSEYLLDNNQEGLKAARGFIDIFHYAAFPLLIRAWGRYRTWTGLQERTDPRQTDRRTSWVGLTGAGLRKRFSHWSALTVLAPVLSSRNRSASNLEALVRTIARSGQVEVRPCLATKVGIPNNYRFRLGLTNHQLGDQAVLGFNVNDSRHFVEVLLSNQAETDRNALLPLGARFDLLKQALTIFLNDALTIYFRFKGISSPRLLGLSRLGLGATLGTKARIGEIVFVMKQTERLA